MLKAKLILIAFCLTAVAGSQVYFKGVDDGIAALDKEAFESYTHFAHQMQHETHERKTPAKTSSHDRSVFAVLEGK